MSKKDINKNKEKALQALRECKGVIRAAAESCGLSRQTIHNYIKDDETFRSQFDEIQEGAIDFVESKLFELIDGITCAEAASNGQMRIYTKQPNVTAAIFYLKTKAKHRGYVERQELTGKEGEDLYKGESDEDLKKKLDELKAVRDIED